MTIKGYDQMNIAQLAQDMALKARYGKLGMEDILVRLQSVERRARYQRHHDRCVYSALGLIVVLNVAVSLIDPVFFPLSLAAIGLCFAAGLEYRRGR